MKFLLLSFLFSCAAQSADVQLRCLPLDPPAIQGAERFFRVNFREDGHASLSVASQAIDFVDIAGASLGAHLSATDIHAAVSWENATLSLLYGGQGEWRGTLQFARDASAGGISFRAGTEIELRCRD